MIQELAEGVPAGVHIVPECFRKGVLEQGLEKSLLGGATALNDRNSYDGPLGNCLPADSLMGG